LWHSQLFGHWITTSALDRTDEKRTAKPKKANLHHITGKKILYEHTHSEAWISVYGLLTTAQNAQNIHLEFPCRRYRRPYFFYNVWMGPFAVISYETSFQSCFKIWVSRVWFIYDSCMRVLHHIFFLQFGNSWTTRFRNSGQDDVDQRHSLLLPLIKSP
jgi:hypothetical protein